jgi:hypothetical protein
LNEVEALEQAGCSNNLQKSALITIDFTLSFQVNHMHMHLT